MHICVHVPASYLEWRIISSSSYQERRILYLLGNFDANLAKNCALQALASQLKTEGKECMFIKWVQNWREVTIENLEDFLENYREMIYEFDLPELLIMRAKRKGRIYRGSVERQTLEERYPLDVVKDMLGKAAIKRIKDEVFMDYFHEMDYVFIDLPDYSKERIGNMLKDLKAVEDFWDTVLKTKEGATLFVIAIQKELFKGHFFFGKMDIYEIEPLTTEELLSAYSEQFKTYEPFTEEALEQIAKLSRGIFRRFLKYICICIENHITSEETGFINLKTVEKAITLNQLAKDMELELSDIFRDRSRRYNAVRIINLLSQKGELNQKLIANELNLSEQATMRILNKLFDYIKKCRGTKNEWLVSLK